MADDVQRQPPDDAPDAAPPAPKPRLPRSVRGKDRVLTDAAALARHDLRLADLRALSLRGLDLSARDLTGARFDESALLDVNFRGAVLDGAVLRDAVAKRLDASSASLRGADALGARLAGAVFEAASLTGAQLRRTDLRGADLRRADLTGADLREADLRGARLQGAVLAGARLDESDWRGVDIDGIDFGCVDMRRARGLPAERRLALAAAGVLIAESRMERAWLSLPAAGRVGLGLALALLVPIAVALFLASAPPPATQAATSLKPPPSPDENIRRTDWKPALGTDPFDIATQGGFESSTLAGWSREGEAFTHQPVCFEVDALPAANGVGRCWVDTERRAATPSEPVRSQGDDLVGSLSSGPFVIPAGALVFRVGGGKGVNTRVELRVDGVSVLEASGEDSTAMREVRWDLSPHAGKEGRIVLVDRYSGPWGRLLADDFRVEGASP